MLTVQVAGVSFRPMEVDLAEEGMEISVVPEPENPHDSNAMAVLDALHCLHFGYVPKNYTDVIKAMLADSGRDTLPGKVVKIVGGENGMNKGLTVRIGLS